MLAPIDKIRVGGNDTIQVVITRNCDIYNCANCTQLLPFRQDAKEMSLECIEESLISLQDWPGITACFGGNPCTHSRFPEVCKLWQKHIPDQRHRGLWTNNLLKYGQVAKETFWPRARFNLNAHGNEKAAVDMEKWLPGIKVYGRKGSRNHHGGMLYHWQDYGLTYEQWVMKRENCNINRNWSAGVYQGKDGHPYAYFCEVAGSLSGVRGEDNGVPAMPGWWKQPMSHFQEQIYSCCDRGCGVPFKATGHQDSEEIYDVSTSLLPLTEKKTGKIVVQVQESLPTELHELTDYIGHRIKRK